MLAGGLFTDLFAVESHMRLNLGDTKNFSEDPRRMELAVIDTTNPEFDQVTAIPAAVLRRGGTIEHKSLPFRIAVRHYYQNSRLQMANQAGSGRQPIANRGPGAQVVVEPVARSTGVNDRDLVTAAVEIFAAEGSLGTWLVSDSLSAAQSFSAGGRTWQLAMRFARYYKPYSVTLQKFTHEKYPGTEIPKNFASRITLIDQDRTVNRNVLIYMNHPLRYRGDTYYQAGFERDDRTSILQVVRNPSFLAPYVACIIVAAGLLVQFGYHLLGFSRRQRAVPA
jgi:hypothetical protein